MDYDKIRLSGPSNVDLPIAGAAFDDVFICKGVDGLGPPEIDVSIARRPGVGGYFQNKEPQNRQIIVRIGINPNWFTGQTPSQLRSTLYGLLGGDADTPDVTVKLMSGATEVVRTTGYISKMEIVPFSKDPQVQLTIECMSAYWSAPTVYHVPSLGTLDKTNPVISNIGDAPTGFYMKLSLVGVPLSGPQFFTVTNDFGKFMYFDAGPANNDYNSGYDLEFNTQAGSRMANLLNTGTQALAQGMLPFISSDSTWLQLKPGNNTLHTSFQYFTWTDISYTPKYWGV